MLVQPADQQLTALVHRNSQGFLEASDFGPGRAGGRKRNHFVAPPHRAFMRLLLACAIPLDDPNIPSMVNGKPSGVGTRPTPVLRHRGNVIHMYLPLGKIADVELAVLDK